MRHAFWRAKQENPESARQWGVALKKLAAGDHYLSVLWEAGSRERPPHDSLKLLGTALLVIVVGAALRFGYSALAGYFGIHRNSGPKTYGSIPIWLQRLVLAAIVGGYVYSVLLPWILNRPAVGNSQLVTKLLRHKPEDKFKQ